MKKNTDNIHLFFSHGFSNIILGKMSFPQTFILSPRWNPTAWLLPTIIGAILLYIHLYKGLLLFDEADYVTAVRQGLAANYLDANAMPTLEFIKNGLRDVLFGEHTAIAKEVRESNDINFYRHNHAPLMFYLLAIAGSLFGTNEMVFRLVAWLTAVLIVLAAYWSMRIVFGEKGRWIGFLAAMLVAVSPIVHAACGGISVHALYAAIALMTVVMQVRYFQTRRLRDFYLFFGLLVLAFLTNEFAPFLFASCLLNFLLVSNDIISLERQKILVSYHLFGGIAVFVLAFFLLWPAGILKLSAVKSYIFFAYFALVKKQIAYGSQSIAENWLRRFAADPVESVLVVFGIGFALYGFLSKKLEKTLLPLFVYPIVILFANLLNRGTYDIYVLSMYPFLLIWPALGIVHWSQRREESAALRYGVAMLVVVVIAIGNITLQKFPPHDDVSPFQTAFEVLKADASPGDRVLVSYGYLPTLNHYLPDFDSYTIYLEDTPEQIAAKLDQRFYRYFIFFGTENALRTAGYRRSLETNYREVQRVPNSQNKILIIFKSI